MTLQLAEPHAALDFPTERHGECLNYLFTCVSNYDGMKH